MICNTCGRYSHSEEANFCEYCGSSFKEHIHADLNAMPQRQIAVISDKIGKPISFWNWMGTYGLLFIPVVGWLVYFVMLFVWAFSNDTPTSKKNWARVTLIFIAIMIIVLIFFILYMVSDPIFQQMMNGTFDYNSYYENLNNGVY